MERRHGYGGGRIACHRFENYRHRFNVEATQLLGYHEALFLIADH
jgi:hypothetical protein